MDRLYDNNNTSGNIEIWKVYEDGSEELFFSDHNLIVSGMGEGLLSLFGGINSNDITDYQIRYFQVGASSYPESMVNNSIVQLSAPISYSQYDPSSTTNLVVSSVAVKVAETTSSVQAAVLIPWQQIRRVSTTSVLYTLVLPRDSANEITLNEVGLFMRSPYKINTVPTPLLVAYKKYPFVDKKAEFSLVYKWTIHF